MTIPADTPMNISPLGECRDAAPTSRSIIANKHPLDHDMDENEKIAKRSRQQYCCRRVPCKARGLSKSHNNEEAYFEIPEDAPHGLLLRCSHPECQASGRKFAYCKVCNLPVAKRNFSARHGHGLAIEFCSSAAPSTTRVSSLYQASSTLDNSNKIHGRPGESASTSFHLAQQEAKAVIPMDTGSSSVIVPALSDAETHWLDLLRPNLDDQVNRSFWMDQLMVDDSPLLLLLDQQPNAGGTAAVVTPRGESYSVSPNDSFKDGLSDDLDRDEQHQRSSVIGENLYLEAV